MMTIGVVGAQWSGRRLITKHLNDVGFSVYHYPDVLKMTPIQFIRDGVDKLVVTDIFIPDHIEFLRNEFKAKILGIQTSLTTRFERLIKTELPWLGMPETPDDLVKVDSRYGLTEAGSPIIYQAMNCVDVAISGSVGEERILFNVDKFLENIEPHLPGVERC